MRKIRRRKTERLGKVYEHLLGPIYIKGSSSTQRLDSFRHRFKTAIFLIEICCNRLEISQEGDEMG